VGGVVGGLEGGEGGGVIGNPFSPHSRNSHMTQQGGEACVCVLWQCFLA
jgi:hypothetical protein